jgi:FkbM family methyltransferase
VVVEPQPEAYELLVRNYRERPKIHPLRVAVHPTLRRCKLYRIDPRRLRELPAGMVGIASLDPEHHKKSGTPSEWIVEEEVNAMPLMEILDLHGIDDLDLLQIDAEGFDAEVIRMIDFDRVTPAIIKYVHVSLSLADSDSTERLLRTRGYRMTREGGDTVAVLRD